MEDTFATCLRDLIVEWHDQDEGTPLTEIIEALGNEYAAAIDQHREEAEGE